MRRASYVAGAVLLLGIASLLVNITTEAQLSGEQQHLFALRRTFSLVLNSGTVWAGVSILAGALMRRVVPAAVAGMLAGTGALVVHYGFGEVTGLMPAGSFDSNTSWFVIALVTGAPLGIIGALTHGRTRWSTVAALVVPLAAVVEPWFAGWWRGSVDAWAVTTSNLAAASILTLLGLVGSWWVVRRT